MQEFSSTMLQNGGWQNKESSTVKKNDLYMAEILEKVSVFIAFLGITPVMIAAVTKPI